MKTKLITPNAVELLCHVNEQLVERRLRGETPTIALPSIRRRAYNVVNELSLIAVMDVESDNG